MNYYVLFSSGIDSWYCLNWAVRRFGLAHVKAIYFDVGQCYAAKEIAAAHALCERLGMRLIVREDMQYMLTEDKKTANIPLRNVFFLLSVAVIPSAGGVVFGMLRGESPRDKNPGFVRRMCALLREQLGRDFPIYTPCASMTKAQILRAGSTKFAGFCEGLAYTIGCHSGANEPCNQCLACFHRWVALRLAFPGIADEYAPVAEWMLNIIRERRTTDFGPAHSLSLWHRFLRGRDVWVALTRYTKVIYGVGLIRWVRGQREKNVA